MIKKSLALKAISVYVEGWKNNDIEKILKHLKADCYITESHGPTYHGTKVIKQWVQQWILAGNRVTKWDIDSFFLSPSNCAFIEWSFECVASKQQHSFDGASVILFQGEKIYHIHEYRMTHASFNQKVIK